MYEDLVDLIDKSEIIVCEKCTHSNLVNRKVLERREQKNHRISLENAVFKKWKKYAVDLGCDLNEALKVIFLKLENPTISEEHIITNLNDYEVVDKDNV